MNLEDEIREKSQEIATESLSMSVGELASLYKDGELDIHPEFQRYYRWTLEQKSKLIESLLLGIPIPPIFVSQTEKGRWDVVDGLQRMSTIFQLLGILKKDDTNLVEPLVLTKTKYLANLEGKSWDAEEEMNALPDSAKLIIKRSRIDVKIVLNKSDAASKYELFQRLNTGGSLATDQEVRNCILIMANHSFFSWLQDLGNYPSYKKCLPLSEKSLVEQFDLELIVRFMVLRRLGAEDLVNIGDLGPFLTEKIVALATSHGFDPKEEEEIFKKTFSLLAESLGEDSFKKFDLEKNRTGGPVLISFFEVIAIGLAFWINSSGYSISNEEVVEKHHSLQDRLSVTATGSGVSASRRIPTTVKLGRELFAH